MKDHYKSKSSQNKSYEFQKKINGITDTPPNAGEEIKMAKLHRPIYPLRHFSKNQVPFYTTQMSCSNNPPILIASEVLGHIQSTTVTCSSQMIVGWSLDLLNS